MIISILESFLEDRNTPLETFLSYYPPMETTNDRGKKVLEFPNKYFIMYGDKKTFQTVKQMKYVGYLFIFTKGSELLIGHQGPFISCQFVFQGRKKVERLGGKRTCSHAFTQRLSISKRSIASFPIFFRCG